ncbi:MAG: LysR family transcription regulator [Gemmatimonadetes bacterium]|nr:LysR family transcription regulator [Gemmatimonadota bacterium]
MILRRLHYFATVAKEGGISRAASRLLVAQPALSRQIHELERAVETPLFARDHRGVQLTTAGLRLRDDVERIFGRLDEVLRRVRLAHEGRLATLRLGLSRGALISQRIGQVIAAFNEQFPDVELVVREIGVCAQAQALKDGDVDVTIGLGIGADAELTGQILFQQRIGNALLAASHPLALDGAIDPHELRDVPLLLDGETLPRFPDLRARLQQLGFSWQELEGLDTIFSYVAAGDGWTIAPSSRFASPPPGLVLRPLRGLDVRIPMVLWRRTSDDLPVLRNLLAVAECAVVTDDGELRDAISRPTIIVDDPPAARATPDLRLHQLVALVTALKEGSLSAAADRVGLTQSAISRQIRGLERAVGVPLVTRSNGRLVASTAGEMLRTEATAILDLVDAALAHARRTARGMTGRCAIGTMPRELMNGLLVGALKQLTGSYPELKITVAEGSYRDALVAREVDLSIVPLFSGAVKDPLISSTFLYDDPLECALLPASHPLADRDVLTPADLADITFLIISRAFSPAAHDLIVGEVRRLGLGASVRTQYNGARSIWAAVASGEGWGIGPRSLTHAAPAGTVARRVAGLSIPWQVVLQCRRDDADPVVRQVAEVFRAQAHATA